MAEKYTLAKNLAWGWHHLPVFYDDHRVRAPNMVQLWELFNQLELTPSSKLTVYKSKPNHEPIRCEARVDRSGFCGLQSSDNLALSVIF